MLLEEDDKSYIKPILNIADYLNPEEDGGYSKQKKNGGDDD